MTTLSFNKFLVGNQDPDCGCFYDVSIHCHVCGATEEVSARLDDLIEWAEQHDCPVQFKGPPGEQKA